MRYYVESYGCTMNFGEGRKLSADMASMGYSEAPSAEEADIVILNTCTVVDTTEKRMLSRISELKKLGKEIVVTGCMAKAQPRRVEIRLPESIIVPPENYHEFAREVAERYGIAGPPLPVKQGTDAILPIAQGCLGNCSYCITKFARGNLKSYPADEMVATFNGFVDGGAKEILVTAQDTACYGRDTGTDLQTLIRSMLKKEGEYRVRIGMMNPNNLMRIWEGLVETFDDRRMYRFLHIPVQSGSNTILRSMRRHYTVEDFMSLVDDVRSACPDVSIATDIICGFPGETDEDHQRSLQLIKDLRADTVNITRFSSRPGTDAALMDQIHGRIAKERSAELTKMKNDTELDVNSMMVGKIYHSLATEKGKEGTIVRTENYRPIVIRDDVPLGTFLDVEVTENRSTYLLGKIVR
ncbi:MAG: tRNA (N(6)-L-threonylcarbamoyladenosine(37)-C(2))-methylthiotransferase [Candidatus Methanomethylophilaceae archaeon]